LPLDASTVQKQLQDLKHNINQKQQQYKIDNQIAKSANATKRQKQQQQQKYSSSTEKIQLKPRADPVYTVPSLGTFNPQPNAANLKVKTPEPRPRKLSTLSKVPSNQDNGASQDLYSTPKNKSLVNQLAEKIHQLPNITNSAQQQQNNKFQSSINRRSSYLSILKADMADQDEDTDGHVEQRIRI
jgi:hypothetical protein